jgi:L-threonylcarbamoyladenylate synthase
VSEPSLVVRRDDRDVDGQLRPGHRAEARRVLEAAGFVLLPSDTAYAVAAWLRTARTRDQINRLLERDNEPISLAFPSVDAVQKWTLENAVADRLLACFTPGPITVVRAVSRDIPDEFTSMIMGSHNRTVGVRIPNSAEERQIAGMGASPVTTVPVRYVTAKNKPPVTSFDDALELVRARAAEFGGAPWCAIEGTIRYQLTSTVVEVYADGNYLILRPGVISNQEIRDCLNER